jgi:hypothetical protein
MNALTHILARSGLLTKELDCPSHPSIDGAYLSGFWVPEVVRL